MGPVQQLDLDVQDLSTGDWDQLVTEMMRNAGDLAPQDPSLAPITGCGCGCACACGCGC
jgi:hypothetical protein